MASTKRKDPRRQGYDQHGFILSESIQAAAAAGRVSREWVQVPLPGVNEECPACHGMLDTYDLRVWWCTGCRREWELVGTLWFPWKAPEPIEPDLPF
jgi:hypothetical protein